jgi:hypothetical protein
MPSGATGSSAGRRTSTSAPRPRAFATAPPEPTPPPTTAHHVPGGAATEIERILVDGDEAVVLGEIRRTAGATGRACRARFALHLTVEDGLVVRHHV